jgi:hypothetical protein
MRSLVRWTQMGTRLCRCALALAMAAAPFLVPAGAATAEPRATAQRLAEAYAPSVMPREQQDPPCDTADEQYHSPTSVNTVLGNPSVTLTHYVPGKGLEDVKKAPTARDIAGLGDDYYLNLHGNPLGETCVYAKDFARIVKAREAPAITYAHIAREPGHSGFALQYWFFWYFNQFNDLHESDWEGMQLAFEADSREKALAEGPSEVIVFQHSGGERADWDDSKVQKDGSHPIVFPAAGSHATFYGSAVWVENGEHGSGLGCDDTSEPLREQRLRPVLLPDQAPESGRFGWLSYEGHWGQREKGYNTGPTGPRTKTQWREPFSWMADQRTTSPRLAGGSIAGPQITEAFCGTVADFSTLLNLSTRSRPASIAILALIAILVGLFAGLTRWRPVDLERLRARRSFGQLIRTARQLYGRHWTVFVPIAAVAIVVVGGTNLLADLLAAGGSANDVSGRSDLEVALVDLFRSLARPVASALVAAIVILYVRELVESRPAGFRPALGGVRARLWRVVFAQLLATAGVVLVAVTIIGIPWAIWLLVGWAFVQQEVLFTDKSLRESFRGSSDLVRGRWWHAVRAIVFFSVLTAVAGPVLTFALIFTKIPLFWVNVLGSLIFALLIPYVAIGKTLLYFDLQARAEAEPAKPRRSWRPWRPRQFGRIAPPAPATK